MAALLGAGARSLVQHPDGLKSLRYGTAFQYGSTLLLARTSRIAKPFWGLRYGVVHAFETLDWALALLTSAQQGWLFSKEDVREAIQARRWHLAKDLEFKISGPLPEEKRFESVDRLREMLEARGTGTPAATSRPFPAASAD